MDLFEGLMTPFMDYIKSITPSEVLAFTAVIGTTVGLGASVVIVNKAIPNQIMQDTINNAKNDKSN